MNKISKALQEINELLNISPVYIESLDFSNIQSFDSLSLSCKVGEVLLIKNSTNKKIKQTKDIIVFETIIPPEQEASLLNNNYLSFPKHWHDCTEKCKVVKGILADKYKNVWATKGDIVTYKPFEVHLPYNPSNKEELHLIVSFTKV